MAGYLSIVDSDSVTDTGESVDDTTDSFENLKDFLGQNFADID